MVVRAFCVKTIRIKIMNPIIPSASHVGPIHRPSQVQQAYQIAGVMPGIIRKYQYLWSNTRARISWRDQKKSNGEQLENGQQPHTQMLSVIPLLKRIRCLDGIEICQHTQVVCIMFLVQITIRGAMAVIFEHTSLVNFAI
jgi:hypothetical protein